MNDSKHRIEARILYDHASSPLCSVDEGPLAGLRHRTVIDRETGSESLALWQEEHLPGFEVPAHSHDCEEIISVLSGRIRASIGERGIEMGPMQSIVIPMGAEHGFRVIGRESVRLFAIFGSSDPKIFRSDGQESEPPWRGGRSDHLVA